MGRDIVMVKWTTVVNVSAHHLLSGDPGKQKLFSLSDALMSAKYYISLVSI